MENSLVIFGSYEKGPEYEEKRANVEKLVTEGLDAHLFYLLELDENNALPKTKVKEQMVKNVERAIELFHPAILAFHNGLTIQLRKADFIAAINSIKTSHNDFIFLLENINHPEKSYALKSDPNFQHWCSQNFENSHQLYDIIWKPKI